MISQYLFAIGLTLVFVGILALIVGIIWEMMKGAREESKEGERRTEYGGVIFIGPIPIVFGSNKDMAKLALIIGIVMFVLVILFILLNVM